MGWALVSNWAKSLTSLHPIYFKLLRFISPEFLNSTWKLLLLSRAAPRHVTSRQLAVDLLCFFKLKPPLVCSIEASSSSSSNFTEDIKLIIANFLRSTCVVAVTGDALAVALLGHRSLPAIAAPILPMVMLKERNNGVSDEEEERNREEYLTSLPDEVEALRSLMEVKMKNHKVRHAIDVRDCLIQIHPGEKEWPLMKSTMKSMKLLHRSLRRFWPRIR